ncbi:MAG: hypothetical protein JZU70_10530 [Chlorobium sp.]|nr:hypothetical protein [Chlorobium sp.]
MYSTLVASEKEGHQSWVRSSVLRGGSWNNNAENCRSANRNNDVEALFFGLSINSATFYF